jgi:two-component system nitrogen regulation response regulator GlnG
MPTLLVVDDEPSILHFFRRAFSAPGVTLLTAGSAAEGVERFAAARPDVAVLDINLPDSTGLELMRKLQQIEPKTPIIFITGHGTAETAIEAMKLGAYEYLLKPLELDHLTELVSRAFEISRLMRVPPVMPRAEPDPAGGGAPAAAGRDDPADAPADGDADALIGRSPAMQEVYKAVGRVAPQNVIVLVLGESGTGKEMIARAVYHHSRRAGGRFLAINCAAIPETLLESELFGHEKGAFTGADRRRIGKFEQCDGGTLFLDEIGDMSPLTQGKILRVLQEQKFERVGGGETVRTDVRLIAATHRDLERMVAEGRFRGDLYYRLSVFTIRVPPLRERTTDIPALAGYFLRKYRREMGREVGRISPEAMDLLVRHRWPGNVRELQSVIKQALLAATGPVLVPEFLPAALRTPAASPATPTAPIPASIAAPDALVAPPMPSAVEPPPAPQPVPQAPASPAATGASPAAAEPPAPAGPTGLDAAFAELEKFIDGRLAAGTNDLFLEWRNLTERHLFGHLLARTGGNLSAAAKILGINRATLRTRLEALGLKGQERSGGEDEG